MLLTANQPVEGGSCGLFGFRDAAGRRDRVTGPRQQSHEHLARRFIIFYQQQA